MIGKGSDFMSTNKHEVTHEDTPSNESSGERKLYPLTEEILEAGESAFWRAFQEEEERIKNLSDDEKIEIVAKRILEEHKGAFKELAK